MKQKSILDRKIRARADEQDDEQLEDESGGSSPSVLETGDADADEILSSDEADDLEDDDDDEDDGQDAQQKLSGISFGTLAKAQESLSKKRKRDTDTNPQHEDKLQALRQRLRELKEANKAAKPTPTTKSSKSSKTSTSSKREVEDQSASSVSEDSASGTEDEDEDDQDARQPKHARTSKHAPTSQSSRHQVTRRRNVVDTAKPTARDPRFNALSGTLDTTQVSNRYAFLSSYRDAEASTLKDAIKSTKDATQKDTLKRELMALENRKRAQEARDREQKVVREHRKQQREAVEGGKKPFYLKESEIKKLALVDKYKGMKGKEREKAVEKKRIREGQKEKKRMPNARRVAG